MFENLPPLLQSYVDYFNTSPVMAVLLGLLIVVIAIGLMRMALKMFLFFLLLLAVALVASYFIAGEETTNDALRQGAQEAGQRVEDAVGDHADSLKDDFIEEMNK